MHRFAKTLAALALACAYAPVVHSQSTEQKIEGLQQEIERLKTDVSRMRSEQRRTTESATSIFGYGEFNYNRYRDSERTSKADLRRFVIGFGHRFNDRLSFNSELEIEHAIASAEDQGEVEMEQAYLNYRFSEAVNVKGGLFLIPLGILNLTHEPPTYYGVERNEVETRIIPTTWRELGFGMHGALGNKGFGYDVGVTTGFNSGKLDDPNTGIRSAHQEGSQADAHDLSIYGALNYQRPGLLVGGGIFTGDTGQNGQAAAALRGVQARLTLWDLHAKYSVAGWDLQALYARGTLGDADRVNAVTSAAPTPFAAPRSMTGWYAQAAYHVYRRGDIDVAPFARFERIDIRQQEDAALGVLQDPNNQERIKTFGVNFYVHPQVVLKADLQRYETDRSKDRLNLGLGYMF
ncbi:MAG TPA: porin [Burkholderiales bacterium]|nr:porin [Burkholderiales bacterium]